MEWRERSRMKRKAKGGKGGDQRGKSESLTMKAITQLHSTVTCFDYLFYF